MTDYNQDSRFPGPDPYAPLKDLPSFPLSSADFNNGDRIPEELAAPNNRSPHLKWSGVPEGTKSLAITCFDPDAPTASGYWHWSVFNLPADLTELPAGIADEDFTKQPGFEQAVVLPGDSGLRAYYGPNPPAGHGPHRYLFAVHAVDTERLDIDPASTATVLGFNLYFHSIARAILWGWYEN